MPEAGILAWGARLSAGVPGEQKRVERKSTATVVRRLFKSFPARVEELWAQVCFAQTFPWLCISPPVADMLQYFPHW